MIVARRIALGTALGILIMVLSGYWFWPKFTPVSVDYKIPGNPMSKIHEAKAAAIERRERVVDQTIWAKEMQAQEHGRVFEDFWDSINAATNKMEAAGKLPFEKLEIGAFDLLEKFPHGIERRKSGAGAAKKTWSPADWSAFLAAASSNGWRLVQVEFRHNAFDPQINDIPARSRFYFSAHLTNVSPASAIIEGDFFIEWGRGPSDRRADASQLMVKMRVGKPLFQLALEDEIPMLPKSSSSAPLIVYDLNRDGILEILLPALNRIYRFENGKFVAGQFSKVPPEEVLCGAVGDFDQNGSVDFLFADYYGVYLMPGSRDGVFELPARQVCSASLSLQAPRVMTCGDIDGDGDLDIYIGQYKGPYVEGSMPSPFYDANDSYPSYLLVNDGSGKFEERTAERGLVAHQSRHVYSASFVDIDADGDLDLITVSDFAGADLFQNDGLGRFSEVTSQSFDQPHAFGMGHTFADFNNDGVLDFLMVGMTSPTADRLEHLKLNRPFSKFDSSMRATMTQGNRLYLAKPSGRFEQGPPSLSIMRSGWTWGVTSPDFDNDGWRDVYVANGMDNGKSVRDFESEFWLRDIFVASSESDVGPATYFSGKLKELRERGGQSFGGYDKNRMFLNEKGAQFNETAHLFGLAVEEGCRNVVSADFDRDGRSDLVLLSPGAFADSPNRLRVFFNRIEKAGNWIGFQFDETNRSAVGVRVTLTTGNQKKMVGTIVTGDSFRSQHPAELQFGLGEVRSANEVEINWPGGAQLRLTGPEINRFHWIKGSNP